MGVRFAVGGLIFLLLSGCVKHEVAESGFKPRSEFSGRLLLMSKAQRFQTEIDWKSAAEQGALRLTHAASGRIVDVQWQHKKMLWRDNAEQTAWQQLSEEGLLQMGMILPPWTLSRIFLGQMPVTMRTTDLRSWKGSWGAFDLSVRWASEQQRVELVDIKNARRAVVIFNE